MIYKIVLIGNFSSGKTTLIESYLNKHFVDDMKPTIGVQFYNLEFPELPNELKVHLWDTAGNERYSTLMPLFYRNTNLCIIVFDVSSENITKQLDKWYEIYSQHDVDVSKIFLLGSKKDQVSTEELFNIKNTVNNWATNKSITNISYISAFNKAEIENFFNKDVQKIVAQNFSTFDKKTSPKYEYLRSAIPIHSCCW